VLHLLFEKAKSKNYLLSDHDLSDATSRFLNMCKAGDGNTEVAGGEEEKVGERTAEDIEKKIKVTLHSLGMNEEALGAEDLFKSTIKEVASIKKTAAGVVSSLTASSEGAKPTKNGASTNTYLDLLRSAAGRNSSNPAVAIAAVNPRILNPNNAGNNPLREIALSGDPLTGFENNINVTKIDSIDKANNSLLHLLCMNSKANADSIIDSISFLCQQMQKEGYTYQILNNAGVIDEFIGNDAILKYLNHKNEDGYTALHLLCKNPHFKGEDLQALIAKLYTQGSSLNAVNNENRSPLQLLCERDGSLRIFFKCRE
jgi:hypothetical protein